MPDAMGNCVVCGSKVNTSNGKCDACDGDVASLRTQLDQERQRREQAEGLLREAEVMMRAHAPLSSLPERIDKHLGEWDG